MEQQMTRCINCGAGMCHCVGMDLECPVCRVRFRGNADGSVTVLGSELKRIENVPSVAYYQVVVDGHMIIAHVELVFGEKNIRESAAEMPSIEHAVACAIWKAFTKIVPGIPLFDKADYYRWIGGGGETRVHIGSEIFVHHCEHENSVTAVIEAMLGIFPSLMDKITEAGHIAV